MSVFVLHQRLPRLAPHATTSHTEHGLMYLARGWLRMEHGTEIEVAPGSISIVPAGVPHRPITGEDLEYWLVGFCAICVSLDESQLLMSPFRAVRHGALPVVTVARGRRGRLVRMLRDLRDEGERGAPESPQLVRSHLLLLLGEVRRAMPGSGAAAVPAAAGSLVSDALEVIQRRCLEPISLEDVARALGRTPAHVTASVKRATGYSVGQWITAGRVAEAANRLAHTDDSLDDITHRVGWRDKTHFIRQFRKAYGQTPAAWRKHHREAHARQD